jgi:hypothetical protein
MSAFSTPPMAVSAPLQGFGKFLTVPLKRYLLFSSVKQDRKPTLAGCYGEFRLKWEILA